MQSSGKVIAIFFILFIAIELILRIFGWGDPPLAILDPDIEYYVKPASSYNRYGNNIVINRYGMRSRELKESSANTLHISILGDSVVYGGHFLDQADTIASKLEKKMHKSLNLDALVSAIAASSWGPQNILNFFNKMGPFSGNHAIVIQSSHDRYDVITPPHKITPPYRLETSYLAISDFILRIWEWIDTKYGNKNKYNQKQMKSFQQITNSSLNKLIIKLKENYRYIALYYHATKPELLEKGSYLKNASYFEEIALKNNIDFINSLVEYNEKCHQNIYQDNIHLNEKGTSCVSNILFNWINRTMNSINGITNAEYL